MNKSIENLKNIMFNSTQFTPNQVANMVRDVQIQQLKDISNSQVRDAIVVHAYLLALGNQLSLSPIHHGVGEDCKDFADQTINYEMFDVDGGGFYIKNRRLDKLEEI